jgi:hypothetical protein
MRRRGFKHTLHCRKIGLHCRKCPGYLQYEKGSTILAGLLPPCVIPACSMRNARCAVFVAMPIHASPTLFMTHCCTTSMWYVPNFVACSFLFDCQPREGASELSYTSCPTPSQLHIFILIPSPSSHPHPRILLHPLILSLGMRVREIDDVIILFTLSPLLKHLFHLGRSTRASCGTTCSRNLWL